MSSNNYIRRPGAILLQSNAVSVSTIPVASGTLFAYEFGQPGMADNEKLVFQFVGIYSIGSTAASPELLFKINGANVFIAQPAWLDNQGFILEVTLIRVDDQDVKFIAEFRPFQTANDEQGAVLIKQGQVSVDQTVPVDFSFGFDSFDGITDTITLKFSSVEYIPYVPA